MKKILFSFCAEFSWDDVKADKHRENYLGHSIKAPVGRWQKGKVSVSVIIWASNIQQSFLFPLSKEAGYYFAR